MKSFSFAFVTFFIFFSSALLASSTGFLPKEGVLMLTSELPQYQLPDSEVLEKMSSKEFCDELLTAYKSPYLGKRKGKIKAIALMRIWSTVRKLDCLRFAKFKIAQGIRVRRNELSPLAVEGRRLRADMGMLSTILAHITQKAANEKLAAQRRAKAAQNKKESEKRTGLSRAERLANRNRS